MRKWVVANFKMYKTIEEVEAYAEEFKDLVAECKHNVAVCPTFVGIKSMAEILEDSDIYVGAQNCAEEEEGAFTGEVSAKMLKSAGADIVIVGHSERRRYYGETDEIVNKKIKAAHKEGLAVIACLADDGGEGFEENIKKQIEVLLDGVDTGEKLIIAFEPVWAIGTGKTMQTADIEPVTKVIKEEARKVLGYIPEVLYGGSVKASNAEEILALDSADGLLVGGASKDPNEFAKICNS
ncbi:MAG: triose-phosphate isomerase [Clostridia bacterium]|nr:triose-phosphate isomerase [Clostridia bacterium]